MIGSVWLPMTRPLSGPARTFHLAMIAFCAGSSARCLGTRWFVAVLRPRSTSPLRLLMTSEVSVTVAPYDAALVTRRGLPAGSGIEQMYGSWV